MEDDEDDEMKESSNPGSSNAESYNVNGKKDGAIDTRTFTENFQAAEQATEQSSENMAKPTTYNDATKIKMDPELEVDEMEDDEMSSEYPQDEEKSFDQSITKSLGTDVKNIMAKMGIKESGSTQVKRVALSPEISPSEAFISKSNNGEQSVDFTKLTYKELRRLEDGIRNGSITEVEL
jgi:hypothetical protein